MQTTRIFEPFIVDGIQYHPMHELSPGDTPKLRTARLKHGKFKGGFAAMIGVNPDSAGVRAYCIMRADGFKSRYLARKYAIKYIQDLGA